MDGGSAERAAYLSKLLTQDAELHAEVVSLLEQQPATQFLEPPGAERLAPGTQLGHYEVIALIGEGGMGQVYRARDLKLKRNVALKVLPSRMAPDPETLDRFQREAEAVAALNHPNVVTLYSVEESDGTRFLTMELVEGHPLTEQIHAGAMSLDDFLKFAIPLAAAVGAAHECGIVHRDLKPANVMVSDAGSVKVLDFGIAKLQSGDDAPFGGPEDLNTTTQFVTRRSRLFGTVAYMSPEQLEGKPADVRSDVFSLGVVLYEMATGTRPFDRDSMLAAVPAFPLETLHALAERRPDLPADLDHIISRCLQKDPAQRYDSASTLRDALAELEVRTRSGHADTTAAGRPTSRARRRWRAVAMIGVAAAAVAFGIRFTVNSGGNAAPVPAAFDQLTSSPGIEWFPSLSPDREWIVYAGDGTGNRDIYLQSTSGSTAINLTEASSDDDDQPTFSPDGQQIAFRSNQGGGGIFVMGRTGEAVRRVTTVGFNPAWSTDGQQLVYATAGMELRPANSDAVSELWTVSAEGGEQTRVYEGDATLPAWSPSGHRIAFSQRLGDTSQSNILTISAGGGLAAPVTSDTAVNWNPIWSPDGNYLYFVSNRGGSTNIWRVAIDEQSGDVSGEPTSVTTPSPFAAHLTISGDGQHIAYSSVLETQNIYRMELDPVTGEVLGDPFAVTQGSRFWSSPDPSPDGEAVVFYSQVQPEGDLYISAADGTDLRQLTGDDATDRVPRWSPDGEWIATFSDRSQELQVWKVRVDGSGLQQVTTMGAGVSSWSPEGTRLAFEHPNPDRTVGNTFVIDAHAANARPMEIPPAPSPDARFVPNSWSQDGRWLTGQHWYDRRGVLVYDLVTQTYDALTDVGEWPVWFPDSRRVLYVADGREFHIVDRLTRSTTRIFDVLRDTLGPPRLTRDGRHAFFSRRATQSDIWIATMPDAP